MSSNIFYTEIKDWSIEKHSHILLITITSINNYKQMFSINKWNIYKQTIVIILQVNGKKRNYRGVIKNLRDKLCEWKQLGISLRYFKNNFT